MKVPLQVLPVVVPRLPIDARGRVPLQAEVGRSQSLGFVDVMEERREPPLPVSFRCLSYSLESAEHAFPALCPERVGLGRVPLGPTPSLHRLRPRWSGFVRRLPWYYGSVRLPVPVHHRRTPFGFPMRSTSPSTADRRGISRFPCRLIPGMHGVFDRAGSLGVSRWRRLGCCLPPTSTASAPRSGSYLSRLNTRPARTPIHASPPPLRTTAQDAGPVWFATPSPYDSSIHFNLPVSPAHGG